MSIRVHSRFLGLDTTNSSGQTVVLQIVPHNDTDGDDVPDDWEMDFRDQVANIFGPNDAPADAASYDVGQDYGNTGMTAAGYYNHLMAGSQGMSDVALFGMNTLFPSSWSDGGYMYYLDKKPVKFHSFVKGGKCEGEGYYHSNGALDANGYKKMTHTVTADGTTDNAAKTTTMKSNEKTVSEVGLAQDFLQDTWPTDFPEYKRFWDAGYRIQLESTETTDYKLSESALPSEIKKKVVTSVPAEKRWQPLTSISHNQTSESETPTIPTSTVTTTKDGTVTTTTSSILPSVNNWDVWPLLYLNLDGFFGTTTEWSMDSADGTTEEYKVSEPVAWKGLSKDAYLFAQEKAKINYFTTNRTTIYGQKGSYGVVGQYQKATWSVEGPEDRDHTLMIEKTYFRTEPDGLSKTEKKFKIIPLKAKQKITIHEEADPGDDWESVEVRLDHVPVDLGVDNNRDGNLALGGSEDQTTAEKPYRFWLNNDHDNYEQPDTYNATDDHPWTTQALDNANEKIESERDLEDFARLHLKIEGIRPALEAGTMTLGFKWKSVQAGAPKIRLFKAADIDGGTKYLSTEAKAADQVSLGSNSLGVVEGTTILDLPVSYWTSTTSSSTKYFLYEGLGEGKGELSIVIKEGNTVIGEGGSVFLDILDIRKMYEQWSINPLAVIEDPDKDTVAAVTGVTAVHDPTAGHIFQPAWDENLTDKNYVICVHGWRKGGPAAANAADFYKGRSDEITMFKRLWHRGFKGRYIGFIWPTYDVTVTSVIPGVGDFESARQSKYDYSEYRAWKCGEAFKIMVNGLPSGYKKKVFAHSLGNVVVASALEKGMTVDNYALLNAAISARCYHKAAPTPINNTKDDLSDDATAAVRALSYRGDSATVGHARLENVGGKLSNFYLPNDRALSGTAGWEDGQYLKPIREYEYDNSFSSSVYWDSSGWTNRIVLDHHEAMAMANTSHSKAVGSAPVLAGAGGTGIDTNIDMDGPGMVFDREHEAVFKWRCARTWEFYSKLWDELDLPGTKAP